MPSVSLLALSEPIKADAVIVGVIKGPDGPKLASGSQAVNRALGGRLLKALKDLGATGAAEQVHTLPTLGLADFPVVIAAGLGENARDAEAVRRAVGAAVRGASRYARVHVAINGSVGAIAEGALLGSYSFTAYKSKPARPTLRAVSIASDGEAADKAALRRAKIVAEAVTRVRDLVNTPPNDLYPETFAARAGELATGAPVTVEVLDERALKRGKYGAVLAVGAGSARAPRLVRIAYTPARPLARVALVGKGITFDSGGLNIKLAQMDWMKSDMGGGAAAIAATLAIAALKLPVEVIATVPMAENMVSGSAYRPSDVITMYNGTTVEVANTDAEGRLILADGIARAVEDDPDYLIETSTLTGAQLVSLGLRVIGAMGEDKWRDRVVAAANAAGEQAWAMPLPSELDAGTESSVADLVNLASDRWAGMLMGGVFLRKFIPEGLPWVHLDIAGPGWNPGGPRDYTSKGGTGAAVRTLIAAVEGLAGR